MNADRLQSSLSPLSLSLRLDLHRFSAEFWANFILRTAVNCITAKKRLQAVRRNANHGFSLKWAAIVCHLVVMRCSALGSSSICWN